MVVITVPRQASQKRLDRFSVWSESFPCSYLGAALSDGLCSWVTKQANVQFHHITTKSPTIATVLAFWLAG